MAITVPEGEMTLAEAVRRSNRHVASSARRYGFEADSRVPFLCECGDAGCRELVAMSLERFAELLSAGGAVLAAGHQPAADSPPQNTGTRTRLSSFE
jgi:hypothetical protein